jgi:hypothetical protein
MTVYVDELAEYPEAKVSMRFGVQWCHLSPDPEQPDLQELHALAAKIGMRRSWFQDHPTLPHYDLTPAKRRAAVKSGAVKITRREWARRHIAAVQEEPTDAND